MGKKQLLLVLLIIIAAGLLAVFSNRIPLFTTEGMNREAVQQDLLAAAAQAQSFWARPALMDGGGRDFSAFTEHELLGRLQIPSESSAGQADSASQITNRNGTYSVQIHGEHSITLTGTPAGGSDDIVLVLNRNPDNNGWEISLDGETELFDE